MSNHETKTQKAAVLILQGNIKKGLSLLSKFKMLSDEDKHTFRYGYEAMVHSRYYAQTRGDEWVVSMVVKASNRAYAWALEVRREEVSH